MNYYASVSPNHVLTEGGVIDFCSPVRTQLISLVPDGKNLMAFHVYFCFLVFFSPSCCQGDTSVDQIPSCPTSCSPESAAELTVDFKVNTADF